MRLIRVKDYEALSRRAADVIAAQVILKPACVLGLATGSSPEGAYRHLIARFEAGELDFSGVRTVNLDEYVGLLPDHPQSYAYFMRSRLFDHVNIKAENTHIPSGVASDPALECGEYDALIRSLGGVDLQLLGIGPNGHIGFNEPGDALEAGTHVADLTSATIQANKRFFEKEEDVPRQAFTMGVRDILQARKILLVASGANKADALCQALRGPITTRVPASLLQLHPDVTIIADEAACAQLDRQG